MRGPLCPRMFFGVEVNNEQNINAWLSGASQEVVETTSRLMGAVEELRKTETIYPAQDKILNALAFTAPEDVRVVILGQDPYHGPNQAMGLSFSVPKDEKLPPSLRNIYKEMVSDLGCSMPESGDLTSWAGQGVLLLNTTLTVREHAANSHAKLGWQVLTNHVIERCFMLPQLIVFLAWGRHAVALVENARTKAAGQDSAALDNKYILRSTHPSPLSANKQAGELRAFMGSRPFSNANTLLARYGENPIMWQSVC